MSQTAIGLLRILMWIACVFHIGIGLALNLDVGLAQWVGSTLYGAQADWSDPQFVYILKPLGAFMIAIGVMAAAAARDPLGQRAIVLGIALLWFLRGLQRILFQDDIQRAFAIPPGRSLPMMVGLIAGSILIVFLLRRARVTSAREREAPAV